MNNNKVNLFILIPESNPNFNWICNLDILIDDANAITYLKNLELFKKSINLENYDGYYDENSFLELVNHFEILDDYFYPNKLKRKLISLYQDFSDWRGNKKQISENVYQIFNQNIENHTLCEISQRKHNVSDENFALLNHINVNNNQIEITINQEHSNTFEILSNESQLINWFTDNRIPQRRFQAIQKHNIRKPLFRNGEWRYPLYKSSNNPEELLKKAIGLTKKELFGYDSNKKMFIVFKFENVEHENQYHGYHVELDSDEVPHFVKNKLL